MRHVRMILNILRSLMKPRHTTYICRKTGDILCHRRE